MCSKRHPITNPSFFSVSGWPMHPLGVLGALVLPQAAFYPAEGHKKKALVNT